VGGAHREDWMIETPLRMVLVKSLNAPKPSGHLGKFGLEANANAIPSVMKPSLRLHATLKTKVGSAARH